MSHETDQIGCATMADRVEPQIVWRGRHERWPLRWPGAMMCGAATSHGAI